MGGSAQSNTSSPAHPTICPVCPDKSQSSQDWSLKCIFLKVRCVKLEPKRQINHKSPPKNHLITIFLNESFVGLIPSITLNWVKKDNTFIVETHRNISGLSTFVTEANEKATSAYDGCLLTPRPVPLLSSSPSLQSQLPGYLDSAGHAPSTTTNNLWLIKQGVGGRKSPQRRTLWRPIGNGTWHVALSQPVRTGTALNRQDLWLPTFLGRTGQQQNPQLGPLRLKI